VSALLDEIGDVELVDGARAARSLTAVTIDDRALTWRPIVVDTPPR